MNAQKLYYTLLSLLGALVVFGGLGYYFATINLNSKTDALQQKLAAQAVTDDRAEQLRQTQKQFQKLAPILPRIEEALPKAKNQSDITLKLQQVAASNGMILPNISFLDSQAPSNTSQTVKNGNILALPITFQLVGTYDQLQSFLRSLESLDRYTAVTALTINRGDAKAQSLSFSLTINVYVKP